MAPKTAANGTKSLKKSKKSAKKNEKSKTPKPKTDPKSSRLKKFKSSFKRKSKNTAVRPIDEPGPSGLQNSRLKPKLGTLARIKAKFSRRKPKVKFEETKNKKKEEKTRNSEQKAEKRFGICRSNKTEPKKEKEGEKTKKSESRRSSILSFIGLERKPPSKWKVLSKRIGEAVFGIISEDREASGKSKQKQTKEDKKKWKKINRVATVSERVQDRHLEMEPLCCLSSCLIRPGCTSVAVMEICVATLASLCCYYRLHSFGWWSPITSSFSSLITHPLVYYSALLHSALLVCAAIVLLIGIERFDSRMLRWHLVSQIISIIFTFLFFGIWLSAQIVKGKVLFGWVTVGFLLAMVVHLAVQAWGITVVMACQGYFGLCRTLVNLADYGHA